MKKLHRFLLTLVLFAPIAPAVAAPRPSTPQQDAAAVAGQELPAAREIIDRFLKVTDPKGMYAKSKSVRMTGTLELAGMGIEGTLEVLSARPNLLVTRGEMAGIGAFANGFDGTVGWDVQLMMGPSLAEGFMFHQRKQRAQYDLGRYAAELFEKVETVGRGLYEGKDCYKVQLRLKPFDSEDPEIADAEKSLDYRQYVEYFEVDSGFLIASVGHEAIATGKAKTTTLFSEYKELAGINLPTVHTVSGAGQKIIIRFAEAELDNVKKDEFLLPADIKTLVEASAKREGEKKEEEKK